MILPHVSSVAVMLFLWHSLYKAVMLCHSTILLRLTLLFRFCVFFSPHYYVRLVRQLLSTAWSKHASPRNLLGVLRGTYTLGGALSLFSDGFCVCLFRCLKKELMINFVTVLLTRKTYFLFTLIFFLFLPFLVSYAVVLELPVRVLQSTFPRIACWLPVRWTILWSWKILRISYVTIPLLLISLPLRHHYRKIDTEDGNGLEKEGIYLCYLPFLPLWTAGRPQKPLGTVWDAFLCWQKATIL